MAEHRGEPDIEHDLADVLDRVRRGAGGIQPRHDAQEVVRHQVARRRRRRRVVQTVAVAATAAVVAPLAVLALQHRDADTDIQPAEPSTDALPIDGRLPAAYFVVQVGGRARGQSTAYRRAAGERYYARFLWFADEDDREPFFGGAAIERWDDDDLTTPEAACDAVVADDLATGATAECTETGDGQVARVVDTTARDLWLDPLHRKGRLKQVKPDDVVRAATVFREDGWAVSVVLCACRAWKGEDLEEPLLTTADLAEAAGAPEWVYEP